MSRQADSAAPYALLDRAPVSSDDKPGEEGWRGNAHASNSVSLSNRYSRTTSTLRKASPIRTAVGLLIFGIVAIAGHRTLRRASLSLVDFDLDGDYSGLRTLCKDTKWVDNRTIWCAPIIGGFANVRSGILSCVRYSIATGSNLVEPVIRQRDTDLLIGMEDFYDMDYFRSVLKKNCPQMSLIQEKDIRPSHEWDRQDFPDPYFILDTYKNAGGTRTPTQFQWNEETKTFRQDFEKVMSNRTTARKVLGATVPIVYRLQWPLYFEWPIEVDPVGFWRNFGRILKFRAQDIVIASEVYRTMADQLGPLYFGAHLRSEYDIVGNNDFTRPETQISSYIQMCKDTGLSSMYVAAGDQLSIQSLRKAAEEHSITVVDKYHLLSSESLRELLTRSFDQQAMVDYLVLLKAKVFGGVAMSSFSADVGARRHVIAGLPGSYDAFKPDGVTQLLVPEAGIRFTLTIYP